jgi:hypothetical protein
MQIHIYALTQHRLSMDTRTLESIDRRLNFLLSSAVGHTDEGDDDTKKEKQVNTEDNDTEEEQQVNTAVRMFDKVCSDLLSNALHGRKGSGREPMHKYVEPAIEQFLQTHPMADLSNQNKTNVCLLIKTEYAQRYAEVRSWGHEDDYGLFERRTYHSLVNELQLLYIKMLNGSE